jgi:5,10-methenyltetrahydrofolate synthetase
MGRMATDDDNVELRRALRRRLIAARAAIDPVRRRDYDRAIAARLAGVAALAAARVIAVYWPIRSEPDLAGLYSRWWADGRVLALPVTGTADGALAFCRWDEADELAADRFGIMTPKLQRPVAPECLLIPCVGFARHGGDVWRLGYGAGYYDRTLARRPVPSVGVAYDECDAEGQFEPTAFDAPMTAVATPSRVISSIASP